MTSVSPVYDRSKVLVGQARRYIAPYTTTSPPALPANTTALNTAWTSPWVELGATMKGLEFDFKRTTKKIMIEEQQTPVQITTDSTEFTFGMELSEDSLETMKLAYGGGVITTTAASTGVPGTRQLVIGSDLSLYSFGFEGVNEFGFWRRVLVPVVVSVADAKTVYSRSDKQRTYAVKFSSLVDVSQVTIIEQNAAAL